MENTIFCDPNFPSDVVLMMSFDLNGVENGPDLLGFNWVTVC